MSRNGAIIAALAVKDLSHRFGADEVLTGIDFEVDEDEFCILHEPSGCCTSTLSAGIFAIEF